MALSISSFKDNEALFTLSEKPSSAPSPAVPVNPVSLADMPAASFFTSFCFSIAFTIESLSALFWLFCTRSIDTPSILTVSLSITLPLSFFGAVTTSLSSAFVPAVEAFAAFAAAFLPVSGFLNVFLLSSASRTSPTSSFLRRASSFCSIKSFSLLASSSDFLALISTSIFFCVLERLTPSFSLSFTAISTYMPS